MTVCVPVFLCCFSVPSLNSRLDLCVKRVFCFAENCGRVLNGLFAGFLNTQIVAQTRPLVAEGTILETGWLFQCNAVAHLSLVGCCFFFKTCCFPVISMFRLSSIHDFASMLAGSVCGYVCLRLTFPISEKYIWIFFSRTWKVFIGLSQ